MSLEGCSRGHLVQHPAQAGAARMGCVQFGVGCLPEGKLHAPLVSLHQGLNTVTIGKKKKKRFIAFSWNLTCFSLCPLPLVLSAGRPMRCELRTYHDQPASPPSLTQNQACPSAGVSTNITNPRFCAFMPQEAGTGCSGVSAPASR